MALPDPSSLTPEQREVLLDVTQLSLDIIGIVEPTPFADASSGLISLCRGDWWGAAASAASVVPYLGDLAKLGKVPQYVAKVRRAAKLAATDARLASLLTPVFERLIRAIDRLPLGRVPDTVRQALGEVRGAAHDFLARGGRLGSRLDALTDDVLVRLLGSTRNVGVLPRQNVRTVVQFFDKYKVDGTPTDWANLLKGIDLHAADAVTVETIRRGETFAQFVETGRPVSRQIGQWLVRSDNRVTPRNLGLSDHGRERKVYRLKESVQVLRSKAAGAADHWTGTGITPPRTSFPHQTVTVKDGKRQMVPAEHVAGGGEQLFLPRAWEFLE